MKTTIKLCNQNEDGNRNNTMVWWPKTTTTKQQQQWPSSPSNVKQGVDHTATTVPTDGWIFIQITGHAHKGHKWVYTSSLVGATILLCPNNLETLQELIWFWPCSYAVTNQCNIEETPLVLDWRKTCMLTTGEIFQARRCWRVVSAPW